MPEQTATPSRYGAAFSLSGRHAAITGGASGLGLALAEAYCEAGARVTILDLSAARLRAEVDRLAALGHRVSGVQADAADAAQTAEIFGRFAAEGRSLDVFVANAGLDPGPGFASRDANGARNDLYRFENYPDARWHGIVDLSLNGVFYGMREAARQMRRQGRGSIIVTTSISAIRPAPSLAAAYAAAKAGAAQLVRAAAIELAPDNVRVNAIAPGPFVTNIADGLADDPELQAKFAAGVPMGRMADPEEIKPLGVFLASDASGFVTGQQIAIDGGMSLLSARF